MRTEMVKRSRGRLPMEIVLSRLNYPLIVAGFLLLGLGAVLVLPYVTDLPSPHHMTVSLFIDGSYKWPPYKAGDGGFILGSDIAGRDILSRIIYGARYSLSIALGAALGRGILAVVIGLLGGWYGGWLRRFIDTATVGFGALPIILLFIILREGISVIFGYHVPYFLLLLLIGLPRLTGQVADLTAEAAKGMHIESAVAVGAHPLRILLRHVAPIIRGPFLTSLAAEASLILVTMGQLAVLGVTIGGIEQVTVSDDPPITVAVEIDPEWAQMMGANWGSMRLVPWLVLGPALSLGAAAAAFQLLAEGLRRRG